MKKIVLFSLISLMSVFALSALTVNKDELKKINDENVIEFINYTGPHTVINSVSSIRGIGTSLSDKVAENPGVFSSNGNSKYSVIHAVDPSSNEKLDADILVLGDDAGVDHIDNLRRIISAYLSSAYGYSQEDSDALAVFITVYNAVYRGFLDLFQNKYKDIVLTYLTENDCGLSVNYEDWPGSSQIVIPLSDIENGGLSTIDTSTISDSSVVKSMKMDDDRNIDSRKQMVDIKEREAAEASDKAKTASKQLVDEQKKLADEKEKTEELKQEVIEVSKEADEKQKIADENPEDEQAQKEAEEAKNLVEEKKSEQSLQEQKQAEQEKKTEELKDEVKTQQQKADKKQTEAQNERKDIAKDQNEVQKKEAQIAKMDLDISLILCDEKNEYSKLVKYNKADGQVVKSSAVSVIRNRTIYKVSDGFIAIAGENKKNGAVKLVLIDSENLEITKESEQILAEASVLVSDNNSYFAVIQENKKYYVGKFNSDLSLNCKSEIEVKAATPVIVNDNTIAVTNSKGALQLLDAADLSAK